MPDLRELYEKFRGISGGGSAAASQALSHPIDTLKGATVDTAKGIGSFLGTVGADLWQGVSGQKQLPLGPLGTHTPSQPIIEGMRDIDTGETVPEWNQRLASVANAATLGLRPMFWDNYNKTKSIDQTLGNMAYDILPLGEIKAAVTGMSKKNPGQIMQPDEYGENISMGLLKFLPTLRAARGIKNYVSKGVMGGDPFVNVVSTAEANKVKAKGPTVIDPDTVPDQVKINDLRTKIAEARKAGLPDIEIGLQRELLDAMDAQAVVSNVRPGFITEVFNQAEANNPGIWKNVFVKSLQDAAESGKPVKRITEQIAETVENSPAIADTIKDIADKYGMTPMEIGGLYPAVAHAIRSAAKTSGQTLNEVSRVAREADRFYSDILKTNPELAAQIEQIRGISSISNSPVRPFTMYMNRYNAFNDMVRGALTTGIPTFMRNLTAGGLNLASGLYDDLMTGTYKYAAGKGLELFNKTERAPTLKEAYGDLLIDLNTMQQHLMGGPRNLWDWYNDSQTGKVSSANSLTHGLEPYIDQVNELYPTITKNMLSASMDELVHANLFQNGISKSIQAAKKAFNNIETVGDGARFALSILSSFNTMQEMFWRKYFFVSELRKNSNKLGFKSADEMLTHLKDSGEATHRWYGPEINTETLGNILKPENLNPLLQKNISEWRLGNAEANRGRALHSTAKEAIAKSEPEIYKAVEQELKDLQNDLQSGQTIHDVAAKLSAESQRVLGGEVLNTGNFVYDAAQKSLKKTFAASPVRGTAGYAILQAYKQVPLLYALGNQFPRFMLNATNWLIERDPTELTKMLSPKFAAEMVEMAKDPTKITNVRAAERFGQAQSGAMLWAAAHALRRSPMAGPKYYQLKAGKDEDGNDRLIDLRVYRPFDQFLFIDHVMSAVGQGQNPNLTAAELTDALLNVRRLNEVGLFAISDIIRQADSSNPGAFINSLKPIAGQYMAGVLTPFRIPTDISAALGHEASATHKDLSGNEFLGPSIQQIPGLREVLPTRPDPFTGKVAKSDHPAVRLLGPNVRNVSRLEQIAAETGLPMNDLFGNYSDPLADRLVRQKLGDLLGRKLANGETMANFIGEQLSTQLADKPIEFKKDLIRQLFSQLRETAYQSAMTENPMAFMEHVIRQQPETMRPILRNKLQELKEQMNSNANLNPNK